MSMSKIAVVTVLLLFVFSAQGCGRKGPLFMQPIPVKPVPDTVTPTVQKQSGSNPVIQSQPESEK